MKIIKSILAVGFIACGLFTAQAQTNQIGGFVTEVELYFTSFNTNVLWAGSSFEISTGYRQVTGVGAQNDTAFQKDIGKFNVGAAMQYSGIGSSVNGAQAQVGYAIVQHFDTEMDFNIRGGYGLNSQLVKAGVVEPGLVLKKLQTLNTATEIGISLPVYFKGKFSNTPTFTIAEVVRF